MIGHVGFKRFLSGSLSYPEISEPEHHEVKSYLGTCTATSVGDSGQLSHSGLLHKKGNP